MNTNFLVNGHWYKSPCKTVLNADTFTVNFFTGVHTIIANVSEKCYFDSIDNITLSGIKSDFLFSRNYTNPKEFLSKLFETFVSFLNTYISDKKFQLCKNTDEVLDRILEIVTETTKAEERTDPEVGEFVYEVDIHHFYGWDTYTVRADDCESAKDKALKIMKNESLDEDYHSIDSIRIYKEDSDELLKEIIFETSETEATKKPPEISNEYNETKELLVVEQFERLTNTLYKSLFKAIGIEETRKIHFIISNNMVFFNYNGIQYKYYPSQCKIFKKSGKKYQRINWRDFAEENNPDGQKQKRGRSPPFLLLI